MSFNHKSLRDTEVIENEKSEYWTHKKGKQIQIHNILCAEKKRNFSIFKFRTKTKFFVVTISYKLYQYALEQKTRISCAENSRKQMRQIIQSIASGIKMNMFLSAT